MSWGDADLGGNSSAVQDQLKDVRQIRAAGDAFAAILEGGKVVTWGDRFEGGDSSAVQHQLQSHMSRLSKPHVPPLQPSRRMARW